MFTNGTIDLLKPVLSDREILQKYNLYHTYKFVVENMNTNKSFINKRKLEELFKEWYNTNRMLSNVRY